MGVILSWFNDRQSFRERGLITELERELGYLIDPIGFDADAASKRAAASPVLRASRQESGTVIQALRYLPSVDKSVGPLESRGVLRPKRQRRVGPAHFVFAILMITASTIGFVLFSPLDGPDTLIANAISFVQKPTLDEFVKMAPLVAGFCAVALFLRWLAMW